MPRAENTNSARGMTLGVSILKIGDGVYSLAMMREYAAVPKCTPIHIHT